MNITDEMLMAYADGELSRDDCRALEARLAQDAGLRARLEPFAMTGSQLAGVFDQPMHERIPDRLLAVVTAGARNARSQRPAERQSSGGLLDAIADVLFPRGVSFAGAFTLTALVAAGGAAGYVVGQGGAAHSGSSAVALGSDGGLVATGDLKVALETQPSLDDDTALSRGAALWPAQSFKSQDQRFCREYRIASNGVSGFAGVACRSQDGEWRVAAHAEAEARSAEFRMLEHPGSPAVDAAVEALRKGDVFGADEEAAAMQGGWKPSK